MTRLWIRLASCLMVLGCVSLALPAAELEVGPGKAYTSIQAAVYASQVNDTILVHPGVYNEDPVRSFKDGLTVRWAVPGNRPVLVGRFSTGRAKNVTIEGFEVKGWAGRHNKGIWQDSGEGWTIRRNIVHSPQESTGNEVCIYSRKSTRITIVENEVYNCGVGITVMSGHSNNGSYSGGTLIRGNLIHDNDSDGINLLGEYFIVEDNEIFDNIAANWRQTHPDGIQIIASTVDGFASARHAIIRGNTLRNYSLGIIVQGVSTSARASDIHIHNNVFYTTGSIVNGADLSQIWISHLNLSRVENVYVFNNTFGPARNFCVNLGSGNGNFLMIKNNIFANSIGHGVSLASGNVPPGGLDHNFYFLKEKGHRVVWEGKHYSSLNAFRSAVPGFEVNGAEGDPQLESFPDARLRGESPFLDSAQNLGSDYGKDIAGAQRPLSGTWHPGAFQTIVGARRPSPPKNLRVRENQ